MLIMCMIMSIAARTRSRADVFIMCMTMSCSRADLLIMWADALIMCMTLSVAARTQSSGCAFHVSIAV